MVHSGFDEGSRTITIFLDLDLIQVNKAKLMVIIPIRQVWNVPTFAYR